MSETSQSFTDPVFLARFGLNCINVLEYFLHPLNPFRSKDPNISNEALASQGFSISELVHYGTGGKNADNKITSGYTSSGPLSIDRAVEEYHNALEKLTGIQYELVTSQNINADTETHEFNKNIVYTIRHVNRVNKNSTQLLGIYYIVEGVIYKSPSVRSLLKAQLARTIIGLEDACDALSQCSIYDPLLGYRFRNYTADNEKYYFNSLQNLKVSRKRRLVKKNDRNATQQNEEDEEALRSSDAIDQILKRLRQGFEQSTTKSDIIVHKIGLNE